MAKFKVGDKVRVLKEHFMFGIGEIVTVSKVDSQGYIYTVLNCQRVDKDGMRWSIGDSVVIRPNKVELVSDKPTKKQRIATLEQQVETLLRRVEALENGTSYTHTPRLNVKEVESVSANQKRKAIIDEAKAFVESVQRKQRDRRYTTEGNEILRSRMTGTEFIVNKEKRTVVAIARGIYSGDIYAKGIAKCAPDDVFNEHIGKAIALGRALGLDVSKFEQAVKPTEIVVGMVVEDIDDDFPIAHGKVSEIEPKDCQGQRGYWTDKRFYAYLTHAKILDDTEAQY